MFFRVLRDMEQLGFWFPEIEALIGVPQNPRFHTEGDVWNHTMLVLDAAAQYREQASGKSLRLHALGADPRYGQDHRHGV